MTFWKKQKIFAKKTQTSSMYHVLRIMYKTIPIVLVLLILTTYYIIHTTKAKALTMSNSNFILKMGNFNSFAGRKTGSGFTLTDTGGQLGPGLYSGTNYKVRAGFQYISSIIKFRFRITETRIDFGPLTATNPVTRIQNLLVDNGSAAGYAVTASESRQLTNDASAATIPNTTCDSGTCTTTTASPWTSTLTYGFGYNCAGVSSPNVCASGFIDNTYFKSFAASPSAATVMTSTNVGRNQEVQLTYKVNIAATQPSGSYTNTIQFVATPTF